MCLCIQELWAPDVSDFGTIIIQTAKPEFPQLAYKL